METDPLGDSLPPRHLVESDDEDEFNPLLSQSKPTDLNVEVKLVGTCPKNTPLLVSTGEAGKSWSKGANLGEQSGAFMVNGIQVGLVFTPPWTKAVTIVSELNTRLPPWAMDQYARYVVETLRPSRAVLLDTYASPSYTSQESDPTLDAPIRYLSTGDGPSLEPEILPFAVPNLAQSTSASFMSLLSIQDVVLKENRNHIMILLPSPYNLQPPPRELSATSPSYLENHKPVWSAPVMEKVHRLLLKALGELNTGEWGAKSGINGAVVGSSMKTGDRGEMGMYI